MNDRWCPLSTGDIVLLRDSVNSQKLLDYPEGKKISSCLRKNETGLIVSRKLQICWWVKIMCSEGVGWIRELDVILRHTRLIEEDVHGNVSM